ncbi:fimbria A protein, partial [Klebsiella pneumoniae]
MGQTFIKEKVKMKLNKIVMALVLAFSTVSGAQAA